MAHQSTLAPQPPRLCLLTETFHPVTGGGENQARSLARELERAGCEVTVLTRRTDAGLKRHELLDRVQIDRLPPTGPGQLRKWGLVVSAFIALWRRRQSCDLILVCGFRVLGLPAVIAGRLLRKPCVLKADTLGELSGEVFGAGLDRLGMGRWKPVMRGVFSLRGRLLRRATAFVAISAPVANELVACGIEPGRIHRIPNLVDTAVFRPAGAAEKRALRTKLDMPVDARIATFTGRLEATKGVSALLAAWARIAAEYPNAHLVLVGSGGLGQHNCEAELRDAVARQSLGRRVTFTGSVDNVADYLRASDLFVFPSRREAFGVSVIEAFACGLPVIATSAGGLADIVRDGKNAIVIPVDDIDALHAALDRAMRDPLTALGAAGRNDALRRYSRTAVASAYLGLLERSLGRTLAGTDTA